MGGVLVSPTLGSFCSPGAATKLSLFLSLQWNLSTQHSFLRRESAEQRARQSSGVNTWKTVLGRLNILHLLPEPSAPSSLVCRRHFFFFNRVAKVVCRHADACMRIHWDGFIGYRQGFEVHLQRELGLENTKSIPGTRSSEVKAALVMQTVGLDGYKSCRLRRRVPPPRCRSLFHCHSMVINV